MRSIAALIRISWLTFTSYRMNVVFSMAALVALFLPVYLVAGALQPVVAESIAEEGGAYFGFLVTGLAVAQLAGSCVRGLPNAISSGISSGTLEALFATPTRLQNLLIGMTGYGLLWTAFRSTLLLVGIPVAGGSVHISSIPLAVLVLILVVLAHLPFGILLASGIIVFRTTGPVGPALLGAFTLLGGVYYSTSVVPSIVQPLASIIPLTYGLRAFRRLLLAGEPFWAVAGDVMLLALFALCLSALSVAVFSWSLRYAKRTGTLAQY